MILALAFAGLHWLDVVGMPYLPGEMERHVQIIDSAQFYVDGKVDTWQQHASRISETDVGDLALAIQAWAAGKPLPNPPTIWSQSRHEDRSLFWVDVFNLAGMSPRCEVQLTSLAWLADEDYCIGCAPDQTFTRQEMVLSRAEALTLASNIQAWLAGSDPDNLIYSKLVSAP